MSKELKEEKRIEREVGGLIDQTRIINFSDAVFDFAATLLVLKIDLPQVAREQLTTAQFASTFVTLWPQYMANIISFLIIGYYWLNHHAIFGMIKKFNVTVVWLNLAFLILLSFIPFPVDLYGDFMTTPIVVVFYSASLAFVGYMLALVWAYASHKYRLIDPELGKRRVDYYLARTLVAPVVFTLSIPLVYIHPLLTQFSWIFILVGIVIINKLFKQKRISKIEEASL